MKLTLSNIKELKRNSNSHLTERVCDYVISLWSDYNDKKGIFTDQRQEGHLYGCPSLWLPIGNCRRTYLLFGYGALLQAISAGNQYAAI